MVSPQNIPDGAGVAPGVTTGTSVTGGRGLVHEEIAGGVEVQPSLRANQSLVTWGSVIAGALGTCSILALSSAFAYACGIPAYAGTGPYGWGAGIWSVLSACVAFFVGGCLSGFLSLAPGRYRMLHGVVCWALTIPLIMLFAGGFNGGMLGRGIVGGGLREMSLGASSPITNQPDWYSQTGAAWGAFFCLGLGLIFAFVGSIVGSGGRVEDVEALVPEKMRPAAIRR